MCNPRNAAAPEGEQPRRMPRAGTLLAGMHPVRLRSCAMADIGVYLPQVGLAWDDLRARVVACDRLGIHSVWFMDHLYPPGLPTVPSFEAWTTAAALMAVTERVRLGHLVLASGFRHPALLAKMAITLDHASGGRLELGLGSGSYAAEFAAFGPDFPPAPERPGRLAELPRKLAVLRRECERIGRDPATLRVTEEAVLALAPTRARADEARATAERRFGGPGWGFAAGGYCGTPEEVVARIRARARLGV